MPLFNTGVMVMNGRITQLKGDSFFDQDNDIFVNREVESFSTSLHSHDFVEICVVGEGSGYHYLEEQVLSVKRGDLFVIPIGTSHVFRPTSPKPDKMLVVYNCIFRTSILKGWAHYFTDESGLHDILYHPEKCSARWLHFQDKHDKFLTMFQDMHWEYLKRNRGYEVVLITLLIQTLTLMQRFEMTCGTASAPKDQLEDIVDFIKSNHSKNITVQYVADYFYMSSSHFQRKFKKSTGLTFTQYLQNVRIQKCCDLLKSTDISIHEIANHVGYQDMKFFHALFRKKTGVTPKQYRKNFQETEEGAVSFG